MAAPNKCVLTTFISEREDKEIYVYIAVFLLTFSMKTVPRWMNKPKTQVREMRYYYILTNFAT